MQTLREEVLPDVRRARSRGRVWAVLDVLHNLRDRIEEKAAPAETEAHSARRRCAARGRAPRRATRAAAPARARAGRGAARARRPRAPPRCARAGRAIGGSPRRERGRPSATPCARTSSAQALRDLAPLKPSLLAEISKG